MKNIILSIIFVLFVLPTNGISQELTPEQIYEKTNDCVVVILSYDFNGKQIKQGSGVVISDKGWIVTNYHVFAECEKMEVRHNEKIIKYTDIIGVDIEKDILILKIEDNTFPAIPIGNSENLKVGQRVYAIGSPLGIENSLSEGIISGLRNVDIKNRYYIQVTASISPGSSGGAIINSKGELIGISAMTLKEGQNMNFAIPIKDILLVSIGSFSKKNNIEANNIFYKGYSAIENGDYEKAIDLFTKYIDLFPNSADAYYNRGLAYKNIKEYSKAISDYTKAIELKPNDGEAYYNRGIVYKYLDEQTKAISDYTKAIEIYPDFADAYNNRGIIYADQKKYAKAILDYDKAIENEPNFALAYYNRGISHYEMKNFSNALSDFDQAIEIDSCFAEAYYNRALIYSRDLTDYKQALLDYDKAIEFNPALVQAYYNRGSVYYFLGKMKKACEDWHKAYSLGDTKAKDLLDEFCK